jgi:hypothetical protein
MHPPPSATLRREVCFIVSVAANIAVYITGIPEANSLWCITFRLKKAVWAGWQKLQADIDDKSTLRALSTIPRPLVEDLWRPNAMTIILWRMAAVYRCFFFLRVTSIFKWSQHITVLHNCPFGILTQFILRSTNILVSTTITQNQQKFEAITVF